MAQPLISSTYSTSDKGLRRWLRLASGNTVVAPQLWALLLASSVAMGFLAEGRHPFLLILCVAVTWVALAFMVGVSWGALVLLFQTAVLDHYNAHVFGVNLRPEWIAATIAIITALATRRRWWPMAVLRTDVLLVVWLALNGIASILFAPRPPASIKAFLGLSLVASAFFIVRLLSGHEVERIANLVLSMGLIVCAFGVIAYVVSPVLGSAIGVQLNPDTHVLMAYGTLWEADIFGAFAAYMLLLSLSWIVLVPARNSKLARLTAIFSALALEVSLARTAWIAAAVGLVFASAFWAWAITRHKVASLRRTLTQILPVVIAAVIASLALWLLVAATQSARSAYANAMTGGIGYKTVHQAPSPSNSPSVGTGAPVLSRLNTLANPNALVHDSTLQLRVDGARLVLSDWRHAPFLGRGTASFGQVYTDTSHQPWWIFNIGLRALHDTGLIGLAIFLLFAVGLTLRPLRPWVRAVTERAQYVPLIGGLFLPTVTLWLTAQATEPFQLMWPWLLLGLIPAFGTEGSEKVDLRR